MSAARRPAGPGVAPLEARLAAARARRRRTVGERVLRLLGVALAALAIALTWMQANAAPAACARADRAPAGLRVLLVAADATGLRGAQALALEEAVAAYFDSDVVRVAAPDYRPGMLADRDLLLVFGNAPAVPDALVAAVDEARQRALRVAWIGLGVERVAGRLGLEVAAAASGPAAAPAGTTVELQGARFAADGMLLARAVRPRADALRVHATLRLADGTSRGAIVAGPGVAIVTFVPFRDLHSDLGLAAAIGGIAPLFEAPRARDPRVLFRLEDLSGRDYGRRDRTFEKTVSYLLAEDVFLHLSLIPLALDASGRRVADIGDAQPVLRLIERHPDRVELIQHGAQHFRASPRNFGKSSGEAYEFFFDDDATMGPAAAQAFARERLEQGAKVLAQRGLKATIFEAPHYTMSPAQQAVAGAMFPVMHHAPLHHAGIRSYLLLPWPTRRDGVLYAPSMLGYISMDDPQSVAGILVLLEALAKILPDPLVVIQYHPFMTGRAGREGDLRALVDGTKRLGYRFASTCAELPRVPGGAGAAPRP